MRSHFGTAAAALCIVLWTAAGACSKTPAADKAKEPVEAKESISHPETVQPIVKPEAEWKRILTPAQFHVLREKGTETAFTGKDWDNHKKGIYRCAACALDLFASSTKFESGTGWPSFWAPIDAEYVRVGKDKGLGTERDEVTCARCGGHLGHVFDDGPQPTGLRYCMNSVAMTFVPLP